MDFLQGVGEGLTCICCSVVESKSCKATLGGGQGLPHKLPIGIKNAEGKACQ